MRTYTRALDACGSPDDKGVDGKLINFLVKEQVTAALLRSVPGSIVIAHMNHPESGTGKGIMAAVPLLKKKSFRFVRLSDYPLQ